jgi:hypothetical protein
VARYETSTVMVFASTEPQGFEARTLAVNRGQIVDVDGLWLAKLRPAVGDATEPANEDLGEDAEAFDVEEIEDGCWARARSRCSTTRDSLSRTRDSLSRTRDSLSRTRDSLSSDRETAVLGQAGAFSDTGEAV